MRLCINLSGLDVHSITTARRILHHCQHHPLPRHLISLEIPERTVSEKSDEIVGILAHLKDAGVGVALDEVGDVYSTLRRLNALSIDTLKIAPSVIQELSPAPADQAVARALLAAARAVDLRVVATGVETHVQAELVRELGFDAAQGPYFSPSMTLNEAISRLTSN